ncbi:peptide methionine sulfoxide reductase [Halapricum sp. CBA1109]|uniref:peptide-methionine (S)-S-oxide reductase MsrA n=1 Tax=Halapricum sp. CBA1109 TaxID=2668068 RepID=UPI0012F740A1|nr:peptide-methionine (S)-S-oxide reductase [Halapricum sp. CBA1109]MUV89178.1 peptide methionine sulfoxide reductase [Halapricum sp. CBA1109]
MTGHLTPTMLREYDRDAPDPAATETVTFGLGCFWGPDARFGAMEGVVRTRVGYAGGTKPDPTYHALGEHTEVVQVDIDPTVLCYRDIMEVVFDSHDPTRQVSKTQYQNVVFADGDDQRSTLGAVLEARGLTDDIATRVEDLSGFTVAEDYHQKHSLRAAPDLLDAFETAGYGDRELRESPAAATLNGLAGGNDLPEDDDFGVLEARSRQFR